MTEKPPALINGKRNPAYARWYRQTPKGKAALKKYNASDKAKKVRQRYNKTDKARLNRKNQKRRTDNREDMVKCDGCGQKLPRIDATARGYTFVRRYTILCDLCDE